jgi:hypothetical protein
VNRVSDPTGKRALFDPSPGGPGDGTIRPTDRQPGTVVTRCSTCGASTRISLAQFALRHFPVWVWVPGKTYSRLLRCAACERMTWQAVSFFA